MSDPKHPVLLVKHAGDHDGGVDSQPNQTHSVFAWTSEFDGRTYAVSSTTRNSPTSTSWTSPIRGTRSW